MAEREVFDAVVVGSGATGGWAAKELTEAGLEVAVLEAGRKLDPATDYSEHKMPYDLPMRGRRHAAREIEAEQQIQKLCHQCDEFANQVKNLFVMDGAVFPSSACQNPTLTMRAVASRACAHLADEYRHGNL